MVLLVMLLDKRVACPLVDIHDAIILKVGDFGIRFGLGLVYGHIGLFGVAISNKGEFSHGDDMLCKILHNRCTFYTELLQNFSMCHLPTSLSWHKQRSWC